MQLTSEQLLEQHPTLINPQWILDAEQAGHEHIGGVKLDVLRNAVHLLVQATHNNAVLHGWWPEGVKDNPLLFSSKISLIHSEFSEALEGDRKSLNDEHLPEYPSRTVEIADGVIRAGDLAGGFELDLANALVDKMLYNQRRADHKKEARQSAGGKTY